MTGIHIFCEGLSSAFTKPTERDTTLEVRQRMKRMPNMMEEVVIFQTNQNEFLCEPKTID